MQKIITRKEAREAGIAFYFTGLPCKKNHIAQRRSDNSDCVDCRSGLFADWYSRNKNRVSQSKKIQYADNAEEMREASLRRHHRNKLARNAYSRKYKKENRVACTAAESKRRKLLQSSPLQFTGADVQRLLKVQKRKCAECKGHLSSYHVDHIMPVSKGGTNDPKNIQILCPPCNRKKGSKHPIDWAKENGRLV